MTKCLYFWLRSIYILKTCTNLVLFTNKNMHNYNPTNLKSKLISRQKQPWKKYIVSNTVLQSRSNVKQCILEWKYSFFWNILFQYFWISNVFKVLIQSSKYSNFISMLYTSYLSIYLKRASLCNWQHLARFSDFV